MEKYEEILAHAGVKGMKWGQRLYQNKDGSLTPLGRLRYSKSAKGAKKRLSGKKGKKKKGKSEGETPEQIKERIMKSPTAEDVFKHKDLFSNKEIGDLYVRLNNEANIKRLIPEKKSKGKAFIKGYIDTAETVANVVDKTDKLYTAGKKAINLYNEISGKKKPTK